MIFLINYILSFRPAPFKLFLAHRISPRSRIDRNILEKNIDILRKIVKINIKLLYSNYL